MTAELERLIDKAEDEWIGYWKEGPTRTRWSKLPPQVGDPATDFEILDANGRMQNLSSFWSDRPALILFWRQYGCGCGVDRAKRLQQEYDDYIAAGANIVIIGQGEPTRATHYAEKYNLPPRSLFSAILITTSMKPMACWRLKNHRFSLTLLSNS